MDTKNQNEEMKVLILKAIKLKVLILKTIESKNVKQKR